MDEKPSVALCLIAVGLLVVVAVNAGGSACPPGEPAFAGVNADGSTYSSCGGTNPVAFLVAGLAALCGAVTAGVSRSDGVRSCGARVPLRAAMKKGPRW